MDGSFLTKNYSYYKNIDVELHIRLLHSKWQLLKVHGYSQETNVSKLPWVSLGIYTVEM